MKSWRSAPISKTFQAPRYSRVNILAKDPYFLPFPYAYYFHLLVIKNDQNRQIWFQLARNSDMFEYLDPPLTENIIDAKKAGKNGRN